MRTKEEKDFREARRVRSTNEDAEVKVARNRHDATIDG